MFILYFWAGIAFLAIITIYLILSSRSNSSNQSNILDSIKWVAVGDEGSNEPGYFISYNGTEWIKQSNPPGYEIGYGIGYDNSNKLVSVGGVDSGTNTIYSSTDAQNWTLATGNLFDNNLNTGGAVVYGENTVVADRWVAGSLNTAGGASTLVTSTDGLSWITVTTGGDLLSEVLTIDYTTVAEEPYWIAGGVGNPSIIFSNDGINWDVTTGAEPSHIITAVKSGPSLGNPGSTFWVGAGLDNLYYSINGEEWILNPNFTYPDGGSIRSLDYGNNLWIFCGSVGIDPIYYSSDGLTWENNLVGIADVDANSIAYGHNMWVLGTSTAFYHSTEGYEYTLATGDTVGDNVNSIKAINL
jgi:hypothetical protein